MTGQKRQKQSVDLYRKLMLRKQLLRLHSPKEIYVPFIGDGDIASELYGGMKVVGADIDPDRVKTASERLPEATIKVADCDRYPFERDAVEFGAADFDAYCDPYGSFRAWWAGANRKSRLVLFFTDGHRQGIFRTGEWIMPSGEKRHLPNMQEKREIGNFYFPRHILPWFAEFVGKDGYRIVKSAFYLRGFQLYWGAVIDKDPAVLPIKNGEAAKGHVKFNAKVRESYLEFIRQGFRRGAAAEQAGIGRHIVIIYKNQHQEFAEEEYQAEVDACEIVEDALFQAAQAGNVRAIETYLTNRSPERWAPRPEQQINIMQEVKANYDRGQVLRDIVLDPELRAAAESIVRRLGRGHDRPPGSGDVRDERPIPEAPPPGDAQ